MADNHLNHSFTVSIGSFPSGGDLSSQHELDLVKSIILYADHITLHSPACWMARHIEYVAKVKDQEVLPIAVELSVAEGRVEASAAATVLEFIQTPVSKVTKDRNQRVHFNRKKQSLLGQLAPSIDRLRDVARSFSATEGFTQLKLAENAGVLSFAEVNYDAEPVDFAADIVFKSLGHCRPGATERDLSLLLSLSDSILDTVNLPYPTLFLYLTKVLESTSSR